MANLTVPIQVNLPDDWVDQVVNRLRNDTDAEWATVVRCKDCKHWLHEHQCIKWSVYGTIETLPNEYCNKGERRTE